jgi:urea carboxylase
MGSVNRVLVANRGEIALRIIRTLTRMGVESVAVYSDADRYAPHVAAATHAARLGPAPAAESYLVGERLLEAAAASGADALHPGYGFVAEDPAFARACVAADLTWIGPTPDQIEQFGRKDSARAVARAVGLPLLAGTDVLRDVSEALAAAGEIGYPVMLKSRAGGGGIGMQRCDNEAALAAAFGRVSRLAGQNFGDPACFLEQCVARARHVEVQIFGDGTGTVVALGERDCSLQRRHQKLVEETPAPRLTMRTRNELAAAAIALGAASSYRSAGTVEFVLDPDTQAFAFLEVNTRLQVEHPVTEAVTGVDLVEWMVRLAGGTLPSLAKAPRHRRGVAIEVRLYAEDPANDFRPSAGVITEWAVPAGVRVDTWVERATEITPHYDALLAKVIVQGRDRPAAITALCDTLAATRVAGIETNLELLRAIAADNAFGAGLVTTTLVDGLTPERGAIDVVLAGPQTTVQEWPGRLGYWEAGVPPSGPMDDVAFRVANRLVGNRPGTAALECTMAGPTLRFAHRSVIALAGAVMDADLDGEPVSWHAPIDVEAGQVLRLGAAAGTGARAYLAVRDGIDVPEYLGSRATFVLGRFGGHAGRALVPGDVLHLGTDGAAAGPRGRFLLDELTAPLVHDWRVRVLPGPHAAPDFFTDADIAMLHETEWEVHHHSDRTGVRLIGPAPQWARADGGEAGLHPSNIHDNEYAIGTIDFTGDMPIILGPDGPSLGGFVCPATVAAVDRWKLGQLRPGDRVRFVPISHEQAVELLRAREDALTSAGELPPSTPARRPSASGAVLHTDPGDDGRPAVTIRRAGDRYVLVEIGENRLDLDLRVRVHALQAALAIELAEAAELAPGIRSLQVRYDPLVTELDTLLKCIIETERALPPAPELVISSRIVHLPLAWDDSQTRLASERYQRTVRADAPWCPSNLEFIRRINGLETIDDVRHIVFDARYLVLGLGDVYLGAPVATPLDPRHRLVTTKYNPARTWTPENAVGIGGAYLCIYGMEGPGGYQFVGRTVQVWSRWHTPGGFDNDRPWLLRHFDQLRFFPVSEEELLDRRADIEHGHGGVDIEPAELRMADYHAFLADNELEIDAFRSRRERAFREERARWAAAGVAEHVDAFSAFDDADELALPPGAVAVSSPLSGAIGPVIVAAGDHVDAGQAVVIVEAMKTEVPVPAPVAGIVTTVRCETGGMVRAGQTVMVIQP